MSKAGVSLPDEAFLHLLGLAGGPRPGGNAKGAAAEAGPPALLPPRLPLVDVRSPGEFAKGHIPGALNLPLFSDAERAEVGTIYKTKGDKEAVVLGLGHAGPKLGGLARALAALAAQGRLALYCSRGGMRSASVAWLCSLLGIEATVLAGGYKAYRRWVLASFAEARHYLILGGNTGSGKTAFLKNMARHGAQVVDIEGLARHRGSAFGALPDGGQPSAEHFENLLAAALGQCDRKRPVWLEDECENLGAVNLPKTFFTRLRDAPLYVLDVPRDVRLTRVLAEYGAIPAAILGEDIDRIKKRLGGLEHKRAHACLAQGDLPGLASILLDYYDRAYAKQAKRRPPVAVLTETDDAAAIFLARLGNEPPDSGRA